VAAEIFGLRSGKALADPFVGTVCLLT